MAFKIGSTTVFDNSALIDISLINNRPALCYLNSTYANNKITSNTGSGTISIQFVYNPSSGSGTNCNCSGDCGNCGGAE